MSAMPDGRLDKLVHGLTLNERYRGYKKIHRQNARH
jgi:hypothetical protein